MNDAWRFIAGLALSLACALGPLGCNAPPVQRQAEIYRAMAEIEARRDVMKIDFSKPLSVSQCEQIAQANSLELRLRAMALEIQDDQVRLALGNGLPKASLQYARTQRSNAPVVAMDKMQFEFEDQTQASFGIQAVVPVLDWGVTYYAYKIAVDRRSQERLLLERAKQLLKRDVRVAYARHAGAMRQSSLANRALLAAREVMKVELSLQREGMVARAETALVEAAMAQAQLEAQTAARQVEQTRMGLCQLMSLPPGTALTIDAALPGLPPAPTPKDMPGYEDNALKNRPELAVQDLERHVSANAVRKEAAGFFPHVDGLGSFNWSTASMVVNPSFFVFGFQVTHALLEGGNQIWRYDIAKKARSIEEERTLLLSLGTLYEVDMQALRLQQLWDTVAAMDVVERSQRAALLRIVTLYREGLEDEASTAKALAELVVQSTSLDRAQTDYLAAWYDFQAASLAADPAVMLKPATRTSDDLDFEQQLLRKVLSQ